MNIVLRELRKKNKYTQEDIAEKIHVSRQTISNWETGKSVPDIQSVKRLSNFYGTDIFDLFPAKKKEFEEKHSENLIETNKQITLFVLVITFISSFIPLAAIMSLYMTIQYKKRIPALLFKISFYYLITISTLNVTLLLMGLIYFYIYST